jgi:GAF domain/ANTAR domain
MSGATAWWGDVYDSPRRYDPGSSRAPLWQSTVIVQAFERAVRARIGDGHVSALSLSQLCAACAEVTSLLASIVLATDGHQQAAVAVSDGAGPVEDLQFTLGEGPGVDAHAEGRAVLVGDLAGRVTRWAHFVPAAWALGVRAAFAFPLRTGAINAGVLSLYADHVDPFGADELGQLATLSGLVTDAVLAMQSGARTEELAWSLANAADHRAAVHQATGMVAMQLECSARDALARLRARAFSDGMTVDDVARRIVERKLRFER